MTGAIGLIGVSIIRALLEIGDIKIIQYIWLFTDVHALRLFLSIGLFVWVDILMLMISLLKRGKYGFFVSLPILIVLLSLLVETSVYSEFRYIYAAFCASPMVVVIALRPLSNCEKNIIN